GAVLYEKLSAVAGKYLKTPMEYLGEVPEDTYLVKAVMQQKPVSMADPYAKSAMAYKHIAAKLANKDVVEKVNRRGMAAFFSNIFNGKR
ncbi:MAG: MinD/ParA family protein, partial [Kineothrix sp.]|nr:MinD/ParA family protein [Kineothrix sp.]